MTPPPGEAARFRMSAQDLHDQRQRLANVGATHPHFYTTSKAIPSDDLRSIAAPGLPFIALFAGAFPFDVPAYPVAHLGTIAIFYEVVLLGGALIFVALGRGLGLFDADEWPAPKTEPPSADET